MVYYGNAHKIPVKGDEVKMSILDNIQISGIEGEEPLYETKNGICIEGGIGTPVYILVTTKRIVIAKYKKLVNAPYSIYQNID